MPIIAGQPPADAGQPFGMKELVVTVMTKVTTEPAAPRMPSRLLQWPGRIRGPNVHPATPGNQLATHRPNARHIQEMSGPLLMKGISVCASYSNHFR